MALFSDNFKSSFIGKGVNNFLDDVASIGDADSERGKSIRNNLGSAFKDAFMTEAEALDKKGTTLGTELRRGQIEVGSVRSQANVAQPQPAVNSFQLAAFYAEIFSKSAKVERETGVKA
jgi:uncharacterized protein YdgA (DUF945 family)